MTRSEIRATVENHLSRIGLGGDSFEWAGTTLVIVAGGQFYRVRDLKSGISRTKLAYALGFMSGIAEASGTAQKAREARRNRRATNTNTDSHAIPAG